MNNRMRIALIAGILGAAGVTGFAMATAGPGSGGKSGHGYGMGYHGNGHGWHRRGGGRGMMGMMEQLDTNKDKKLTQEEVDAARTALLAAGDADNNGQLTLEEFEAVFLAQMRQMMVRQFQHLDKDGNAIVTSEEFNEPYAGIVAQLDRNNDGVVDANDRGRGKGKWRNRDRNRDGGDQMEQTPDTGAPADDAAPAPADDAN